MESNEYWKKFAKCAGIRALKTTAQTAVSLIGTNTIGITEIDWVGVASGAALAGILSVLTSFAGLPEVEEEAPAGKHVKGAGSDEVA